MNEFDIVVEATDNYIENTDVDDVIHAVKKIATYFVK